MANNLNVNGNMHKWNTVEELRERPPEDMVPFYEEITICKTEIKEEVYDVEAPIDNVEFITVKEEYISLPEKNFKEENLDFLESREQLLDEDLDFKNHEIREGDHQVNLYTCELCETDFEEEIMLNRHYEQCPFAEQNSFKKGSHLQHNTVEQNTLKKHTLTKRSGEQKKFKCSDCKYSTNMKTYLARHILIHAKEKSFKCTYKTCNCMPEEGPCKCDTCGFAAAQKDSLKLHILMKHGEERKKYKCKDCNYSTCAKSNLIRHTRIHTNEKPFKCTYKNCNCTPEQEDPCKCDTCGYASAQQSHLRGHILMNHSGEQKKYRCSDCEYSTNMKTYLARHARIHSKEKPFKCTYKNCNCTPEQKDSCQCDACGYTAVQKNCLILHILKKHSGEQKKYKCSDCQYCTQSKEDLLQHTHIIHKNETPFKCTYKNCNCTPEQQKYCKCDVCGYASAQKSNLKLHILAKHSRAEKKYNCKNCKYSTHIKQYLVKHAHIHSNERPYKCTYKNCKCSPEQQDSCQCDTCGFAAVQKSHLSLHILTKHS